MDLHKYPYTDYHYTDDTKKKYPYTVNHEINLDYLLDMIKNISTGASV